MIDETRCGQIGHPVRRECALPLGHDGFHRYEALGDGRTEREHRVHALAGRALAGDHDTASLLGTLRAIAALVGDAPAFPPSSPHARTHMTALCAVCGSPRDADDAHTSGVGHAYQPRASSTPERPE